MRKKKNVSYDDETYRMNGWRTQVLFNRKTYNPVDIQCSVYGIWNDIQKGKSRSALQIQTLVDHLVETIRFYSMVGRRRSTKLYCRLRLPHS